MPLLRRLLLLLPLLAGAAAQALSGKDAERAARPHVCQSVDVRNSVEGVWRLRGCAVVEGFVQIVLIDGADEASWEGVSFPELREVTDYLLLYRADGLRSLAALFPNLAVIRGNNLFFNYALVAFEMMHLHELGLHSLTDILRGGVRLEKNPLLCYADSIDWNRIAPAGKDAHYIGANRPKNECPMLCPADTACPRSAAGEPLCWNSNHCQRVCPKECGARACDAAGRCCHASCLGSCSGATDRDCAVCRNVVLTGQCLSNCPHGLYKYLNRRCINASECRQMPIPPEAEGDPASLSWKPVDGRCLLECPARYAEHQVDTPEGPLPVCLPCKGPCRKECNPTNVDSIASAQRLRGCTYIKGALEIQISGGKNIVKELEDNLNMIEEIEGYLKIVRSFPLVSLNFLKRLRVIRGTILESDKYALVVLDNQNLQELWDWDNRQHSLNISRGRLFFHFNPKLCLSRIEKLRQVTGLPEFSDLDVAPSSNGDKVACNVTNLEVKIKKTDSKGVIISWKQFDHYDPRSLLGYVVYYTEAPFRNLTLYDGRDACGSDGWRVVDVWVNEDSPEVFKLLSRLKPFTQYAFYVRTYTIATERTGAQSEIQYFVTLPDVPTPPQVVRAFPNSSSDIVIEWKPPLQPNGNVTHYVITGGWAQDDPDNLERRNYCVEPLVFLDKKTTYPPLLEEEESKEDDENGECCTCKDSDQDIEKISRKAQEAAVQAQIHFEDSLQNQLYVKRLPAPSPKTKRSVSHWTYHSQTSDIKEKDSLKFPSLHYDNEYLGAGQSMLIPSNGHNNSKSGQFMYKVYRVNTLVVHNLKHFAAYTVGVQACRELEGNETENTTNCSPKKIVTVRTHANETADNINPRTLTVEVNQTVGTVKLRWEEPKQPNGIIVTYQIEYGRVDRVPLKSIVECTPRSEFIKNNRSYMLVNLSPGNYSLRVRATSLAGNGNYTETRYFYIQDLPSSSSVKVLVGGLVSALLLLAVVCAVGIYMRRRYLSQVPSMLIASVNPEYVQTTYVPDEWEVPREKIKLVRELGQGSFGMVWEGIYCYKTENERRCAVKTVNEHATDRERSEFLNEASVMKAFNTHHVVQLLGVVSKGQPVLVVMELMANGDLKTYLRSHRPDVNMDPSRQPPTLKRILQMAVEIADGMAYLSAKKFVHRDLAARNCMVAEDLTVKIGDFGMTRDIYETDYYRKGSKGLLPVRWMAPESLKDGVFTSSSDVWSYGVVLWEMATLASQPYQGLSNDQVLRYVIDGGVMERPENCPDKLYELMRLCWEYSPNERPAFVDLVYMLLPDISESFAKVSFYHSPEGCELRQHRMDVEKAEDDPATPLREDFHANGNGGNGVNGWIVSSPTTRTTQC